MDTLSQAICNKKNWKRSDNIFNFSDFGQICDLINGAQKFVLSNDVTAAVSHVSTNRPSTLLKDLEYARAPFEVCWFEFDFKVRIQYTDPGWTTPMPSKPAPRRIGFLVQSQDSQNWGIAHVFWQFHDGSTGGTPYALLWDNRKERSTVEQLSQWYMEEFKCPALRRSEITADEIVRCSNIGKRFSTGEDLEALTDLHNRAIPVHSWLYGDLWNITARCLKNPQTRQMAQEQITSWIEDLDGEIRYLCGILCMLNCKNALKISDVDNTERNQFRYRNRKPPLHSYKVLKLLLTDQQKTRAIANGITDHAEMRLHLVRGHFKNRKTGRFWWSPFTRGNIAAGTVEKEYQLLR